MGDNCEGGVAAAQAACGEPIQARPRPAPSSTRSSARRLTTLLPDLAPRVSALHAPDEPKHLRSSRWFCTAVEIRTAYACG